MLKQLIQRLVDSRTTPSEAAHSAMPQENQVINYGSTTENPGSWTTILSFTAPKDGYAKAVVVGTGKNSAELYCGNMRVSAFAPVDNASINVVIPVRKGASVGLVSTVFRSAALYFVPSIGGGYNRFVRRALSCLRPSFNYLPRSFCKAKNLGFQNNQLLSSIRALISLAQAPRISLVTSLRATAGQLLDATQIQSQLLKSKSRTGRWHLLPFLTETLREPGSVVTLKKGHRLSSCAVAEVQPIILFGSTKQVQTFNPLTGGALC